MCDYSLMGLPNRLATEGDRLMVHTFPTHAIGLASVADLANTADTRGEAGSWWSNLKLRMSDPKTVCAVCVPPGARLLLRDIPEHLQQELGVGPEEEVTFVELSVPAYHYRDAVRFRNGCEILLQKLREGQRVEVLCLAAADSVGEQELESSLSHTV